MSDFQHNEAMLRTRLAEIRALILQHAQEVEGVGTVEESLKWGQASFATTRPKSGTPIRLGSDVQAGTYSLFVPCATSLIANFRDTHPDMFVYHGNREIRLDLNAPLPETELGLFIAAALTYYLP